MTNEQNPVGDWYYCNKLRNLPIDALEPITPLFRPKIKFSTTVIFRVSSQKHIHF